MTSDQGLLPQSGQAQPQGAPTIFGVVPQSVLRLLSLCLPILVFSCAAALSAAAAENGPGRSPAAAGQEKLLAPQEVLAGFATGATTRVIVLLTAPAVAMRASDYQSPAALGRLHSAIQQAQQKTLQGLTPGAALIRHRFENIPGFSAEVTTEGLQQLMAAPEVVSIETRARDEGASRAGHPADSRLDLSFHLQRERGGHCHLRHGH
jgi:hypothetical protein